MTVFILVIGLYAVRLLCVQVLKSSFEEFRNLDLNYEIDFFKR